MNTIDIIFDGPPSHESGRFVEVERDGKSINYGEWEERDDGLWALRIFDPAEHEATIKEQAEEIANLKGKTGVLNLELSLKEAETHISHQADEIEQLKAENKRMKFDLASFTSNVVMNGGIQDKGKT